MAKINDTYDIGEAFEAVENELMASMIRNMKRHRIEEIDEKKEWEMWQALQLKSLEQYKKDNAKRFQNQFREINGQIESLIYAAREQGGMEQEMKILQAIKKGFRPPKQRTGSVTTTAEFFKLNDRKLDALIKATQNDFQKAETAVLRMANDQYRKIIYNAQVYANTGAGTYEKAVDMATKDFLSRGINCIEYANGARHTIADYAAMAIQTASKRAYLQGEGEMRKEWGISTVIMNKRGNPCPKCLPFVGKVLIDDVWSGGKASDGPYPLMSSAIAAGLYHPRCKDIHTTYFEGISTPPDSKFTRQEIKGIEDGYRTEQKQQYAKRQADRFGRLAECSLDEDNQNKYAAKHTEWEKIAEIYNRHRDGQRVVRKSKSDIQQIAKPVNKDGEEIIFNLDNAKNQEGAKHAKELISQLAEEYNTFLYSVSPGAKRAAGDMNIDGTMRLSNYKDETIIHEFGHSLAMSSRVKLGLASENEVAFMKELTKIRTEYEKAVVANYKCSISSYSHENKDEFLAEAFAHAKMRELGLEIPSMYGEDFTYSQRVLDTANKYFKKSNVVERGISEKKKYNTFDNVVNIDSINTKEYREKFNVISGDNNLNQELYQRSKDILIHRNGTNKEDMYLISSLDAKVKGRSVSAKVENVVEYNKSLNDAVKSEPKKTLISIHNHGTNLPPTGADFASAGSRGYKKGIVVCHNGDVYVYEVGDTPFSSRLFDDTVEKYKKNGYTKGIEAHIKTLEQFEKNYGIKWRKL